MGEQHLMYWASMRLSWGNPSWWGSSYSWGAWMAAKGEEVGTCGPPAPCVPLWARVGPLLFELPVRALNKILADKNIRDAPVVSPV